MKNHVLIDNFKRQTMSVPNGVNGFRNRIPVGYELATFQIPKDVAKTWNAFQFGVKLVSFAFVAIQSIEFLGICGANIPRPRGSFSTAFRTYAYFDPEKRNRMIPLPMLSRTL